MAVTRGETREDTRQLLGEKPRRTDKSCSGKNWKKQVLHKIRGGTGGGGIYIYPPMAPTLAPIFGGRSPNPKP